MTWCITRSHDSLRFTNHSSRTTRGEWLTHMTWCITRSHDSLRFTNHSSLWRVAKETCNLIDPTNQSHPIVIQWGESCFIKSLFTNIQWGKSFNEATFYMNEASFMTCLIQWLASFMWRVRKSFNEACHSMRPHSCKDGECSEWLAHMTSCMTRSHDSLRFTNHSSRTTRGEWLPHMTSCSHDSLTWLCARAATAGFPLRCTCVTWLIHICDMMFSDVWHDSCIWVKWLVHMGAMTHSYDFLPALGSLQGAFVSHDSFIYVTWRIHMCDMTHSWAWHDALVRMIWLIDIGDVSYWYGWRDVVVCVTCRMFMDIRLSSGCIRDKTHSFVSHDSFICVTRLIHVCHMTHSYVLHHSFMCHMTRA